jgi:hypothetical protein
MPANKGMEGSDIEKKKETGFNYKHTKVIAK